MKNSVYVGNLPRDCSEDQLRELLSAEGRAVTLVTIVTDKRTGRSRGFAFVEYGTEEEAAAAIEATRGAELQGKPLRIGRALASPIAQRDAGPEPEPRFRPRGGRRRR